MVDFPAVRAKKIVCYDLVGIDTKAFLDSSKSLSHIVQVQICWRVIACKHGLDSREGGSERRFNTFMRGSTVGSIHKMWTYAFRRVGCSDRAGGNGVSSSSL